MLHDLPTYRKTDLDQWMKEIEHLFVVLSMEYEVVPLSESIGPPGQFGAAERF
jgi:hypothetical protein